MNLKNIALTGIIILITLGSTLAKGKYQAAEIKVAGNCGSCEKRIEKAAYQAGAKTADWDSETQTLSVTWNTKKTSEQEIEKAVLSTGHDVNSQKADDQVYESLPACCQYRDRSCTKSE